MPEADAPRATQTSPSEMPTEMFTLKSVSTLAGASTGLYLVLGTISSAFGWAYPRWFPLLAAFVLVLLLDFISSAHWRKPAVRSIVGRLLVIVLNSCLIFTSSMGGATALSSGGAEKSSTTTTGPSAESASSDRAPEPVGSVRVDPEDSRAPTAPVPMKVGVPSPPPRATGVRAASATEAHRHRPPLAPRAGFGRLTDAFLE
jgi:hypothetical protein